MQILCRGIIACFVLLLSVIGIPGCSQEISSKGTRSPSDQPSPPLAGQSATLSTSADRGTNRGVAEPAGNTCLAGALQCEAFESGTLDVWRQASPEDLGLLAGAGYDSTTGLSVASETQLSYIYQKDLAHAGEAYLTFWFNPNGANLPAADDPQRETVRIASVIGEHGVLVALRVYSADQQSYKAYLEWSDKDGSAQLDNRFGQFDLVDGWQKITIGYRVGDWIAAWVNDEPSRETEATHADPYGTTIALGRLTAVVDVELDGTMLFDDVVFHVPYVEGLWVDAEAGDDANSGQSPEQAFRTIQRAADVAGPGTTVHILPGIYRESVIPAMSGTEAEPVVYTAEDGPGTAAVRGSEPASSLTWTQLTGNDIGLPAGVDPTNIYYADLSTWGLEGPPRFVVELEGAGEIVSRLWPAREPDWQVVAEWKSHEFWWFADGGSAVAGCDPTTDPDHDCDYPWRSFTELTDTSNDADPVGIELGNLTTLGDLTGASLVALDALHAHYLYRRPIIAHDVAGGHITVDEACDHDGEPGLGWGSKYYVENHPALLDNPGEWWFDVNSSRLYLWSPTAENPATLNLEISRLEHGFDLENRSYVSLVGLTVELFNGDAYRIYQPDPWTKAYGNKLSNVTLRYADRGVLLYQYANGEAPELYAIDGFVLEGSEVAHMDTVGVYASYWWSDAPAPDDFSHAGVRLATFRNNELHHLGYNADHESGVGVRVFFPDRVRFEGNHIHHVAQNGAHFHLSLVDSTKEYDFSPEEIKLGQILVKDNVFETACQLSSDCGALKFGGNWRPYTHVFRDVLVTGNVFRDTFGWSYVSIERGLNTIGDGNGLYVDNASGIHAYRNIAYNNSGAGYKLACLWRDGDIVYYNNIAANNYNEGFEFTGPSSCDDHAGSVNTQLVNNMIVNNDAHGVRFVTGYDDDVFGNLTIDHNLYYNNGWNEDAARDPADIRLFQGSGTEYFHNLSEIRSGTPWEDNGVEGGPGFLDYDLADHDRFDGSWPDFHVTAESTNVVDRGTAELPSSLARLLAAFGIRDVRFGDAFDIGRYEAPGVLSIPAAQGVQAGRPAYFTLSTYPPTFPGSLTLAAYSGSPDLTLSLSAETLSPGDSAILTVTNLSDPDCATEPHTITIAASYGGGTQYTKVQLLVGGSCIYLPLIRKEAP